MSDRPTRVLVVDDEPEQVRALTHALSADGFLTTGSGTPAEALTILRSAMESHDESFDILVTDLRLPDMDGIELLRQAQLVDPDLVAIVMTGHGSIHTAVEAMKSGALEYVLKPFNTAVIRPVLSRALTVRRLRLQNTALLQDLQEQTWELEVKNQDLRCANRELNAFAHTLSAELRDPLGAMLDTLAQALAEQPRPPDSNLTSRLTDMVDRCRRMIDSLDALWHLSDLSARPLAREWLDVRLLVEDVLRELGAKGAEDIAVSGLPEVIADRKLLKMVFAILLSVLLEHGRTTAVPKIEITGARREQTVTFLIRASDVGFGPPEKSCLVGPFDAIPDPMGLRTNVTALSLARRMIERLGGRLSAESFPGRGVLFDIRLPG